MKEWGTQHPSMVMYLATNYRVSAMCWVPLHIFFHWVLIKLLTTFSQTFWTPQNTIIFPAYLLNQTPLQTRAPGQVPAQHHRGGQEPQATVKANGQEMKSGLLWPRPRP